MLDVCALRARLEAICLQADAPSEDTGATIPEPYTPYVPDCWNGVLVLAEAQNHAVASSDYVTWLKALSSDERIRRLYLRHSAKGEIGIQPWDDGTLPLAITAALGVDFANCAVSNAVLWSTVTRAGGNASPQKELIRASRKVWRELLRALEPELIILTGAVARDSILPLAEALQPRPHILVLTSPSKQNLNRTVGNFDEEVARQQFPELNWAGATHPKWLKKYRKAKIFFAVEALKRARGLGLSNGGELAAAPTVSETCSGATNDTSIATVLREVDTWPVKERLGFAAALWDRMESTGLVPPLTHTQRAALNRVLVDADYNPEYVRPPDQKQLPAYKQMGADEARELEALDWSEGTVGDAVENTH